MMLQWKEGAGVMVVGWQGFPYFGKALFQDRGLILCVEDSHIDDSV